MNVSLRQLLLIVAVLSGARAADAVTIRYAIIIGNNDGMDMDGSRPFSPLMHAEREARVLGKKLVRFSSFDPSPKRTRIITGASREQLLGAARDLVRQKAEDQAGFGRVESLFLFYFTGHGLDGRILLDDGAMSAEEIGEIFGEIDADFSIGIFDACFAGSLSEMRLKSKGIQAAPKLNLFSELPEEVLSAEGSIWYVSSGRDQESYEDELLGGVFTHFFIEGLEKAPSEGPGITLENIWQYARARTVAYTTLRKRIQIPEQYIAKLRSNAPIFFSFTKPRTASIVLSPGVAGRFALAYNDGNLTEVFEKSRGEQRKLSVYPGQARLIIIDADNSVSTRNIELKTGQEIVLSDKADPPPLSLGHRTRTLYEKGGRAGDTVIATAVEPRLTLLTGVGWGYAFGDEQLLYARHGFSLPFRFDISRVFLGVALQYGYDHRSFPAWSYSLHEVGGKLLSGIGFDVHRFRWGVSAVFRYARLRQRFFDGSQKKGNQLRPALALNLLFPGRGAIQGEIFAEAGLLSTPGITEAADRVRRFYASLGVSVYYRLF